MHFATRAFVLASMSLPIASLAAQESKAMFHSPLVVLPVDSPPFQRLADIDGDGDLDAIGTRVHGNGANNEVKIWRNDSGVFTPVWSGSAAITYSTNPTNSLRTLALATGDFDLDGRTDFVLAGRSTAQQFLSSGNWTFQTTTQAVPSIDIVYACTGDFDADGALDYAVVGKGTAGAAIQVQVFLASGGTPSWLVGGTSGAELRIGAGELDGQPGADLLVFDRSSSTARVLALSGGQLNVVHTLQSTISMPGATTAWKWIAGDVDADQDADVIIFRPAQAPNLATYQIFRRTSPTTLVAETPRNGGPSEYLADIDGDGDLDGVCCGGGGGPTYSWPTLNFPSMFQIAVNRGGGDFAPSWDFPGTGSLSMGGTGDIDGDGDIDFVAGRCVCYGRGPWQEHPSPGYVIGTAIIGRPRFVHDIDRDGDVDFLTGRNSGDGTMTWVDINVTPPPGKLFAASIFADVDGDGAPDLIQRQQTGSTFECMVLQRNNGGGTFTYSGPCAPPGLRFGNQFAYAVDNDLAADCDGDGDIDVIATSDPGAGEGWFSQIFWNNGGVFAAGPSFIFANGGRVDAVADFDNDGWPDLLMSGAGTTVKRGTGNIANPFVDAWTGPGKPFEPSALVVADLNDDGWLDFAAPIGPTEFKLFINYALPGGPFGFADHSLPGIGVTMVGASGSSLPRSPVAAADFDGDGKTDLVLGRAAGEPNVSTVLRRISWSNPPSLADYEVTKLVTPGGFAGDVDGDGDVDLVANVVTRNVRFHGASAGSRLQSLTGVPGENGSVPLLGISGPFRCGENPLLHLTGVPGPTIGLLCVSLGTAAIADLPLPGLTYYLDPATSFSVGWNVTTDGQGRAAASASMPILLPFGLQGLTFQFQAFVLDAAAPTIGTQTNLLSMRVGS